MIFTPGSLRWFMFNHARIRDVETLTFNGETLTFNGETLTF